MKQHNQSKWIPVMAVVMAITCVLSALQTPVCAATSLVASPSKKKPAVKVATLSNYDADCTYITTDGQVILIDIGEYRGKIKNPKTSKSDTINHLFQKTTFQKNYTIDHLVITHNHHDHTDALKFLPEKAKSVLSGSKTHSYVTISNIYVNALDFATVGALYTGLKRVFASEYVVVQNVYVVGEYQKNTADAKAFQKNFLSAVKKDMDGRQTTYHNHGIPFTIHYANSVISQKIGKTPYTLNILPALKKYGYKQSFLYEISPDSQVHIPFYKALKTFVKKTLKTESTPTKKEISKSLEQIEQQYSTTFSPRSRKRLIKSLYTSFSTGKSPAETLRLAIRKIVNHSEYINNHCLSITFSDTSKKRPAFHMVFPGDIQAIGMNGLMNNKTYAKLLSGTSRPYQSVYYKVAHHGFRQMFDFDTSLIVPEQVSQLYHTELRLVNLIQPTQVIGTSWSGTGTTGINAVEDSTKNRNCYSSFIKCSDAPKARLRNSF